MRTFVWFVVGGWWGARLMHRATRLEVELARFTGYLDGGNRVLKIQRELTGTATRRARRWWRS